jgi:hypothetical protein
MLALSVIVVAVVAVVGLVGFHLVSGGSSGSAGPTQQIAFGSDGTPDQIDGRHVYLINDQAKWENLGGSFLLAAFASNGAPSCPMQNVTLRAESDLLGCPEVVLGLWPSGKTGMFTAPKGLSGPAVYGWVGHVVVVRAHTHDPEAVLCGADRLVRCEAALVLEAVVWPVVPSEVGVEQVYRATDQASFANLKGSFLLGGLVTYPDVVTPCPSVAGPPGDGQGLLPYCYWPSIDGLALSPKGDFNEPGSEIVVARVHVNDPLAAQCQPAVIATCRAVIVVESVVWRSNPYATASPTPVVAASTLGTNPASIPDMVAGSTVPA